MIRRITEYAALALALTLPLAACDSESGLDADTGSVSLLLTDAPGDVEAAVVTISKVYLQGDGGEVVLMEDELTTDLLTLANDVAVLAEDVVVPAGSYGQLRFVITGGYVEVDNGDGTTSIYATPDYPNVPEGREVDPSMTFECPSCDTSGLKVDLTGGAGVIEGDQKILLVDFDVSQSFKGPAGNSGKWMMRPVVKISELSLTGSVVARLALADTVELPLIDDVQVTLGDFSATLSNAEGSVEEIALTDEDEDGVYEAEFRYLIPGDYTVGFEGAAGVDFVLDVEAPVSVSVGSGQQAEVSAVVTSAAASGS